MGSPRERGGGDESERRESAAIEPAEPEIVVGIVAAVGTPIDLAVDLTTQVLEGFGYSVEVLHLSNFLDRFKLENPPVPKGATLVQRIDALMTRGTEAREVTGRDDILALAAIADIHNRRGQGKAVRARTAYVLRQLKHPAEIQLLRETYGEGFFALGFYSPRAHREQYMRQGGARPEEIERLIDRDEHEGLKSGQRFRDTFHLGDAFVLLDSQGRRAEEEIRRIFSLVFGTEIITPSREEFGMFQAFGAALRSAQMGRQVGACLLSSLGDVVSVGTNEVPRAHGGSYWEGDEPDGRDHRLGVDSNDEMKARLIEEILDRLEEAGLLRGVREDPSTAEAAARALMQSRIAALIEFGRAVHAEADAISAAGRLGVSTRGTDLFCTTFPCHLCAKQIVAAGIRSVTFIEPYPKSLATELHGDAICLEDSVEGKVLFKPFVGVAPRRYIQLFSMLSPSGNLVPRKGADGRPLSPMSHPRLRMSYFSALERERLVAAKLDQITHEGGTA